MNSTGYLHAHNPDPKIIDQVLSEIDSVTLSKILNQTTLPIEHLISPKIKSRKGNIPRPQNPFVIYRRDFMAKLTAKYGPEIASNLPFISKKAGNWWKHENQEVKNIYETLADLAKKVHERMYPGYIFKPRKRRVALNHDFDHLVSNDLNDFCQPQNYTIPPSPQQSIFNKWIKFFCITNER
jgi:hypothetical protein